MKRGLLNQPLDDANPSLTQRAPEHYTELLDPTGTLRRTMGNFAKGRDLAGFFPYKAT